MNSNHVSPGLAAPVTVVIPTFNRAGELHRALHHLSVQSVGAIQVVVVDNSSTDATESMVRGLMPAWAGRLRYIRKEPNGPASARNAGVQVVDTPYVLFHDSDVELPPEWVERALSHLDANPGLAAVGGYILYAFDLQRVNAYGGDMGYFGLAWDVDEDTPLDSSKGAAARIWINCSAMLARRDALMQVAGFDERYFYGYEDSDLGWRLNLAGYRLEVHPDLKARHHVDPNPGNAHAEIVFHYCKNRLRSILKNASVVRLPFMLCMYGAYTFADLLLRPSRKAKLRALAWNAVHLPETLALRGTVQAGRVCADSTVFRLGSGRWLPPNPLGGHRRRPSASDAKGQSRLGKPTVDDRV